MEVFGPTARQSGVKMQLCSYHNVLNLCEGRSEFRAIDIDGLESSFEADEKNARYVWNTFHAERW